MRLAAILMILFMIGQAQALTTDSITQYNITWNFDKEYEYGTYANGDYWVKGPLTLTSIEPAAEFYEHEMGSNNSICTGGTNGINQCKAQCSTDPLASAACLDGNRGYGRCVCVRLRNGWESNPHPLKGQSFDERAGYYSENMPTLPYTANPGESIVKTLSLNPSAVTCRPCLERAAILTVVDQSPAQGSFRPAYVGTEKNSYLTDSLRLDLLPNLSPVEGAPTLDKIHDRYQRVQLDHGQGLTGRSLHPLSHMPDYGGDIAMDNGDAALRLMLNDNMDDKMPALISYVQYGIDLFGMIKYNHTWPDGGGHRPGQRIVIAFTATMLDDEELKIISKNIDFLEEDLGVYDSDGMALYGYTHHLDERSYWNLIVDYDAGYRAHPDPYGFIDGGPTPGTSYQLCCTSNTFKGQVLAKYLMPALSQAWDDKEITDYTTRWVEFGTWTQPDPCAPADGKCEGGTSNGLKCTSANKNTACPGGTCNLKANWPANYGVTFGPDGNGSCIKDSDLSDGLGRFPQEHGSYTDGIGGGRRSSFQAAMWTQYYAKPSKQGDLNHDGSVDLLDIQAILGHFGRNSGYPQEYELSSPGIINLFDVMVVVRNWGMAG